MLAKMNPKKGTLPVLQYMPPPSLKVDPHYQRSIDSTASRGLINRIARDWDWDLCQPLVVARRADGSMWVVDGQHRLQAAILRGDIQQLPCNIVFISTVAEEAGRFVAFNRNRQPLKPLDMWRAALAGQDSEAVAIADAVEEADLKIYSSTNNKTMPAGYINNIGGLYRCLKEQGEAQLTVSLDVMAQAFKDQPLQYCGTLFTGIASIVKDECAEAPPRTWQQSERFIMLTDCLSATPQAEWYRDVLKAKADGNFGRPRDAAQGVFRAAWAECVEAFGEEQPA